MKVEEIQSPAKLMRWNYSHAEGQLQSEWMQKSTIALTKSDDSHLFLRRASDKVHKTGMAYLMGNSAK